MCFGIFLIFFFFFLKNGISQFSKQRYLFSFSCVSITGKVFAIRRREENKNENETTFNGKTSITFRELPLRANRLHWDFRVCVDANASNLSLPFVLWNKLRGLPSLYHLVCLSFQLWYTPRRASCACAHESEELLPFRAAWISVLLFTLGIIVLECVIKRHVYLHTAHVWIIKKSRFKL